MAFSSGGSGDMMAEINVTPFVDVMLVLLIIFMVTTPMMTTGVDVELPRADAPPMVQSENDQLILSITADGAYHLLEHTFTLEELAVKLPAIMEANPNQDVFLRADGQVPYEKVAQLMVLCRKAGVPRMGMITQASGATE
jgi:biopolymer transport protein TolR